MHDEGQLKTHANDAVSFAIDGGGVVSTRARHESLYLKSSREPACDVEEGFDENEREIDNRDLKKRQVFKGWTLIWLAYQSMGVVYGDIGTSPLYVYSSTFSSPPTYDDILGAVSLIIWSLTIMVTIKYACIVLNADDEGEGGTFALYSLISRYANLVERDLREIRDVKMERYKTNDLRRVNRMARSIMERSALLKWTFKIIGIFGVCLLLADGVLTPAQSILGAIQGVTVVNPNISSNTVVGISCAILVVVFFIQPFGTSKIASTYAPIIIIWLLFNLTFGIYNLVIYDASVFKAFSPYFAGAFLQRNGRDGWIQLGGILLAFTGVETLFADLGAFSKRAIQLSWLCFAYPCLLIGYIGQAAHISRVPSAYANPFYLTVPPGMLYPSLIFAVLACIVASQATITGCFQLLSQVMKVSYFPQMKVVHTSKEFHGQIYIPFANWILMAGTLIVTGVYNNTTKIGEAYGACVILVSFLTTCMVSIVALIVWRMSIFIVLPIFITFALWDGMFLSSALTKVPHGAWFTLMIAAVLSCIFLLWRFGKEQQWKAEESDIIPLSRTLQLRPPGQKGGSILRLHPVFGGAKISQIEGLGIFFDKVGMPSVTPTVFLHFIHKFAAATDVIAFFNLRPLQIPTVDPAERYTVLRCFTMDENGRKQPIPNCFRLIVRYGYTDEVITPDLGIMVAEQVRTFLQTERAANGPPPSLANETETETTTTTAAPSGSERSSTDLADSGLRTRNFPSNEKELYSCLDTLKDVYSDNIVYIVGKEQLRIKEGTNIVRRLLLTLFLLLRDVTRTKIQNLNVRVDRLVEIGFVKDI